MSRSLLEGPLFSPLARGECRLTKHIDPLARVVGRTSSGGLSLGALSLGQFISCACSHFAGGRPRGFLHAGEATVSTLCLRDRGDRGEGEDAAVGVTGLTAITIAPSDDPRVSRDHPNLSIGGTSQGFRRHVSSSKEWLWEAMSDWRSRPARRAFGDSPFAKVSGFFAGGSMAQHFADCYPPSMS